MSARPATFDDRRGHRGRGHKNLLLVRQQVVIPFAGETIPGVVRVLRRDYAKQGKWSHSTWSVECAPGVLAFSLGEDWETGEYFNSATWAGAAQEFRARLPEGASPEDGVLERAIRALFPRTTERLDREAAAQAAPVDVAALVAAQEELAAATREAAATIKAADEAVEIARLREQAGKVREALAAHKGGRMSLADLRAAVGGAS